MSTLLIKNIRTLVSCDSADTVYENVDLYAENGFIKAIGASLDRKADKTIDASHMLCYPGLVNTHHHLYQVFSRNLPEVQNMELFDWLKTLYEIWKNLDAEVIRLSSLTGMGELMKHGCTTCFDHHYVFPKDTGDLLGAQFGAADELGIRMYASRGSMDLSVKDGGLPPDSVVQTVDEIMKDSERVIAQYHDRSFGAMHRVALAPCSPFSVSADLLRESAVLARQLGVLLVGEGGEHIVEVIVGVLKIGAQVVVRDLVRAALAVDGVKQLRVHHARLAVGNDEGILSDVLLHGIRDIAPRGGGQALGLGLLVLRQRDAESVELIAQIVDFLGVAKSLGTDPVLRGLAVDLLIKQGDRTVHALLLPGRVDGGIEVVHVHADRQTVAVFLGAPALIGGGAAGRAERQNDGERQSGKL